MSNFADSITVDLAPLEARMRELRGIGPTEKFSANNVRGDHAGLLVQLIDGDERAITGGTQNPFSGIVLVGHYNLNGAAVGTFELHF